MGYVASVESDLGDRFKLLRPDGTLGGKALGAFLVPLHAYCPNGNDEEMRGWISRLELHSNEPICHLVQPLLRCYYTGELQYEEDAFSWFLQEIPQKSFTKERLESTIQELLTKWVDAHALLLCVNKLTKSLTEANLEATWWYDPEWTLADFQALSRTLTLVIERGAERARIKFT